MQWILACYGDLTTVNQTVTNITETTLHAYVHADTPTDKRHVRTLIRTQTVQTIWEAPSKKAPLVN